MTEDAPVPTAPYPDALVIPDRFKSGRTMTDRLCSIADIAEPILGMKRDHGERAVMRKQEPIDLPREIRRGEFGPIGPVIFATRSSQDTLYFPRGHPLSFRNRYAWVRKPDGIWWGWLVPEAKAEETNIRERVQLQTPIFHRTG